MSGNKDTLRPLARSIGRAGFRAPAYRSRPGLAPPIGYQVTGQGHAAAPGAGAPTTISATFVAGETVLVAVWGGNAVAGQVITVSDAVNTYAAASSLIQIDGATGWVQLFKADAVAAGTVTISGSSTSASSVSGLSYLRVTGLAAGAVLASVGQRIDAGGVAGANNLTSGLLTPPSQPAALFGFAAPQNATVATSGAGFNNRRPTTPLVTTIEDRRITEVFAVAATFGTTATFDGYAMVAVLIAEASGGSSAALTGQAITSGQGALVADISYALTGQAITAGQGTITPDAGQSVALTGQAITAQQGALAPSVAQALTSQAITGGQGSTLANVAPALTGQALTGQQGSLAPVITRPLTGQAITGAQGSVTAQVSYALNGQAITPGQGTLTPEISQGAALTGQALTAAQGSVKADVSYALTGQAITSGQGMLLAVIARAISGQAATAQQGTLTPQVTRALTGQAITAGQGSVSSDGSVTRALTGQAITAEQGSLTAVAPPSDSGGDADSSKQRTVRWVETKPLWKHLREQQETPQAPATRHGKRIVRKAARAITHAQAGILDDAATDALIEAAYGEWAFDAQAFTAGVLASLAALADAQAWRNEQERIASAEAEHDLSILMMLMEMT